MLLSTIQPPFAGRTYAISEKCNVSPANKMHAALPRVARKNVTRRTNHYQYFPSKQLCRQDNSALPCLVRSSPNVISDL